MQRLLSAVVLLSLWALVCARAEAQIKSPLDRSSAAADPPSKKVEERLSDEAELAKVVNLYEAGKYRECGQELERLLDPTGRAPIRHPGIVENARVYWAACLIGGGDAELAEAPLRAAIHENPQMKPPDSLVFPQPVVQRFFKVRDSLVTEIRAAEQTRIKQAQADAQEREQSRERDRSRMRLLEELAQQETVVVVNRRVLSFVPFGVGQIQNRREALGYSLMVSQLLFGSAAVAAETVLSRLEVEVEVLTTDGKLVQSDEVNANYRTWGEVRNVSFWTFAVLAVGGVVHAQLDYTPEFREVRRRKVPAMREPTPTRPAANLSAAPYFTQQGAGLNVSGRF